MLQMSGGRLVESPSTHATAQQMNEKNNKFQVKFLTYAKPKQTAEQLRTLDLKTMES